MVRSAVVARRQTYSIAEATYPKLTNMPLVHRSKSIAMIDNGYGNRAVNGVMQYSQGNTESVQRMVFKGSKRSMTLGTIKI